MGGESGADADVLLTNTSEGLARASVSRFGFEGGAGGGAAFGGLVEAGAAEGGIEALAWSCRL
jgi:hypothetical protein